ncbi:MAG: 5'/3'-nucleotidase SurE [Actinomycetes bacterium]
MSADEGITVLLTNDDGGTAIGLMAARQALIVEGMRVIVVAPDGNRSAIGHAITSRDALRVTLMNEDSEHPIYFCSGTPADCVRVGLLSGIANTSRVVVSGINHGINLGDDIHYSGTVAAAAEAALLGLPAIAASQHSNDIGLSFILGSPPKTFPFAPFVARTANWLARNPLPPRQLLNINMPASLNGPNAVLSELGVRNWNQVHLDVEYIDSGEFRVLPWVTNPTHDLALGSDFTTVAGGFVSVSLLSAVGGLVGLGPECWSALEGLDLTVASSRPTRTNL